MVHLSVLYISERRRGSHLAYPHYPTLSTGLSGRLFTLRVALDGPSQHASLSELFDAQRVEVIVSQLNQSLTVDRCRRERSTVLWHVERH